MDDEQKRNQMRDEPADDGLSALRQLAALDSARARPPQPVRAAPGADEAERMPDWLELLLAKYGEQATMLTGLAPVLGGQQMPPEPEATQVASLLEHMASETEAKQAPERLATSVDWGKSAQPEEAIQEPAADWLSRLEKPSTPPASLPLEEEAPDWLSEISKLRSEPAAQREAEGVEYAADAQEPPEWLRELGAATLPPATGWAEETPGSETQVPDWLRDLGAAPPPVQAAPSAPQPEKPPPGVSATEAAEVEVPDWLAHLAEGAGEKADSLAGAPAGAGPPPKIQEEAPEWLREVEADFVFPEPFAPEVGAETPVEPQAQAQIPDWLRELGEGEGPAEAVLPPAEPLPPPSAQVPAEAPAAPQAQVPDWLREPGALEEAPVLPPPGEPLPTLPQELAAEAPAGSEEEVPDWLRELEAHQETPAAPPSPGLAAEVPAEPAAEIPDWLASLRGEGPSALEMIAEEAQPGEYAWEEEAEEPDWLATLRTTSPPDVLGVGEEVIEAKEETLPDWLAELRASQATAQMPPAGLEVAEEVQEGIQIEEPTLAEFPEPELAAELPEAEAVQVAPGEALPPLDEASGALDWLTQIEAEATLEYAEGEPPEVGAIAPPGKELIPESEKATIETTRLPAWLVGLGEGEAELAPREEEVRPVEEAPPVVEPVAAAEIPDWLLKFRPGEGEPMQPRPLEPVEAEDVLAGIPGVLPIVEEAPEARREPSVALRPPSGVPTVPDVEGAQLFQQIAAERQMAAERPMQPVQEVKVQAAPEARRRRPVETLVWALIFIVLIAAIALALMAVLNRVGDLLGGAAFGEFFGSPLVIDPAPVNTFRAQVNKLSPDAVVVVSFDYSPATEAEMGPLAHIIVRDLLESQARVVAVSLRPEGAPMAQRLFESLEGHPPSQRTVNLGYLPGQAAGVRSLAFISSLPLFENGAQTLQAYPAWQDVKSLDDVALVVVVADSPLAVRWWVEQMGPGTLANRPMVAAVSSAADPMLRPYYNQIDPKAGQLLGLISGTRDAAAYEHRLEQPGRAVHSLAAQSVAHLGLVALGLGGTLVGFRTHAARAETIDS